MDSGAIFSSCERYRYLLARKTGVDNNKICLFIMLNPSTADEEKNDPTITRCINYARSWGFGRLYVANLFAYRATSPKDMKAADDPYGEENGSYLRNIVKRVVESDGIIVCAWGTNAFMNVDRAVLDIIKQEGGTPMCLKMTKSGHPSHPLYLKSDLKPVTIPL